MNIEFVGEEDANALHHGLYLGIMNKKPYESIEILQLRMTIGFIDYAVANGCIPDAQGKIPITIEMPCGHSIKYDDIADIPFADVPCSCGNPNHWFIKYNYSRE